MYASVHCNELYYISEGLTETTKILALIMLITLYYI